MAEVPYQQALDLPLPQLSGYPYDLPKALVPLARRPVRELRDEDSQSCSGVGVSSK